MRPSMLLALLLAMPMSVSTAAPAAAVDIPIPDIPYTKFVLKNGLTVLVHEDHKSPVVAVNTWYHVGSKNEKRGKTGFAHLFEHLMFSGSANFDKTFLSALEGIGASDLNGTTNKDRTNYFETVPTSMLDYALFAESDRMGHLLGVLDRKKLDLQRGVVQNEKRQRENQPYGVVEQIVTENTWPANHPYSWTTIGAMEDLDAASMQDVTDWFRGNYGPNNVVLVLAGDLTPAQAREKVEKYYGDIPPGPPVARQREWIARRSGTHRSSVQDRVPQARIYRVWNVPGADTPEEALLDLAAHVLGGSKTSRLYQRLVVKEQLATSAFSSDDSSEIAGQFGVNLTARPGADVARMERIADEELRALMKTGPREDELRLAKTAILAQYARIVERVGGFGGKSDMLARCMTFTGDPDCYKTYLKRIQAATPAMVRQAMLTWLGDGDYVLQVDAFPAGLAPTVTTLDRSKGPPPGHPEKLHLPPMQSAQLSNGLKVVLAERHGAPVVNLSMMIDAGFASDSHELPGLASLTLRMLEEGTSTRSSLQISAGLEGLGASFGAATNLDGAFVNMNVLAPTLPRALGLYADLVLHPSFPQADFERLQRDRIAAIAREKTVPRAMALRVLPGLIYGKDHAYGLPLTGTGTEAAVARMTRADLVRYHQAWFKPNNATLLVVGDTTMAALTPLLEKAFAGWRQGAVPSKNVAQVAPPDKAVIYLIDRPGALQSDIVGAQLAPPRNTPDAVALNLLNDVFGGTFSSRLNMKLREDKHWSYGVGSSLVAARGQRILFSGSPVQTDQTAPALRELVREYADIAGARPITQLELKAAQDNETLGLPGAFETIAQLSNGYATILQYRLPEDYYNTYTDKVLGLGTAELNALAARTILPKRQLWIVVGDMSKVEADVRALGLGEVRKIDADGNLLP
ncbi:putative zinc protease Rv2782c [Massilia sp. Bi118]|uniref:M16 family metallopeptidase n=1 Tax=Massilia sp. Bi118 TaxID=2822346 RepID=UPI001D4AE099|nr:pitrilysin family protein [Massilia sp. Bi118]CAH0209442.1 putative zinc protease Rv2782c [Massilia sp. Bi118]